jgi:NTP pyrophosphatase (non-canonical NTP hydrolase)
MGELSSELARVWIEETSLLTQGRAAELAREQAINQHKATLRSELADCMAYLLKIANYAGVDLEAAYLEKMQRNQTREWHDLQED